ncbi:MAG: tRNA preQ1(34) S-adenosylmethionine ribosyltransferase-isomerase QueA [candidate division Zixibacteria bacterium]|nr:tRNA preQ1(34) S-adenosylmethionine ribosyltransferase-isomerase QueA [candidate division Zixibacteria bacterium]
MKLTDFDFKLPRELIAKYPLERRDSSRLLVLHRRNGILEHKKFFEVIDYLNPEDVMVINQTKVFPARLFGINQKNGANSEVFLLRNIEDKIWEVLLKPRKKIPVSSTIVFNNGKLYCEILDSNHSGATLARFDYAGELIDLLEEIGNTPLPPYIKRKADLKDKDRYQTVYARDIGAVAAPTAGLHFTKNLLEKIKEKGVDIIPITMHIGWGTFRPVRALNIEEHKMEEEYFEISRESVERINSVKKNRGRVFAVGTSVVRTLETMAESKGKICKGWTDKFIYPSYDFKMVDGLITNFHLPKSTLFLLVSAFAGKELILKAYQEAIKNGYRFYSYGDAMLIL